MLSTRPDAETRRVYTGLEYIAIAPKGTRATRPLIKAAGC